MPACLAVRSARAAHPRGACIPDTRITTPEGPPPKEDGPRAAQRRSRQDVEIAATATDQTSLDLEVYRFPVTGQGVRVNVIGGAAWFIAADACRILGIGRPQDSVRHLDDDERGRCLVDTPSGTQEMLIVSEPGLYSLILRSRRSEAKAFKRWITHEVLPSIRRTGAYAVPHQARAMPALGSPEGILALAEAYHDAAKQLVGAQQRVSEMEPAAAAWDVLAEAKGDYSLRDAAHILNRDPAISMGQNRLMRLLRDEGMVDRKGVPYAKHERHLVERPVSYSHPHTGEPVLTSQIRITPDGLAYLRKRLGGIRGEGA